MKLLTFHIMQCQEHIKFNYDTFLCRSTFICQVVKKSVVIVLLLNIPPTV